MRLFRIFNQSLRRTLPAVAALGLAFAACGDDDNGKPNTGDNDASDGNNGGETPLEDTTDGTDGDASTGGDDGTGGGVATCEDITCNTTAPANCSEDNKSVITYEASACVEDEAGAYCSTGEIAEITDCAENEICAAGACISAGDLCEYEFDERVSYVTEIRVVDADDCCFDFGGKKTGTAIYDNKLGSIIDGISGLADFDVNATLQEQIDGGSFALLLETVNVDSIQDDNNITVNGFYGSILSGDAPAGEGHFVVQSDSFFAGSSEPLISFPNTVIEAGVLKTEPSLFRLTIPLVGVELDLKVSNTLFEAEVAEGPLGPDKGIALGGENGAKLGGLVAVRDLASAFNLFLDAQCSCIAKKDNTKDYVEVVVGSKDETVAFNIGSTSACDPDTQDMCIQIGTYAGGAMGGLIGGLISPDIDTDEDGILDSISIGVRLKATSGTIDQVDVCE